MRLEKPLVSSCNPSVYYNWSKRSNIALYEHRLNIDKVTIFILELLKQSRPGHHLEPMVLLRYPDQEICVASHLERYTGKTKDLREDQNLLINFVKLHKRITTSTISRWCVTVLKNADVDVTVFGSYSTRSASIAHCKRKGLSVKQINKAAGS